MWNAEKKGERSIYLSQIRDAQHKANGIQYIGFSSAIETGDCSELFVKTFDFSTFTVRFETIQNQLFHVHFLILFRISTSAMAFWYIHYSKLPKLLLRFSQRQATIKARLLLLCRNAECWNPFVCEFQKKTKKQYDMADAWNVSWNIGLCAWMYVCAVHRQFGVRSVIHSPSEQCGHLRSRSNAFF